MARYANAVVAKTRAIYGRMLSPAQYDELLRKQSVQEISAYLREKTPYASALAGVQDSTIHRGQLENLLHKDLFYQYVRLIRYLPGESGIYRYIVMDMEIELILMKLRGIISGERGEFIASMPTFMEPYANFSIAALAQAHTLPELIEVVAGTEYEPVLRETVRRYPPQGETLRFTRYEVALRILYFTSLHNQVKASAHGKAARDLLHLINIRAELMNINVIYRMKTYFQADAERIRVTMMPFYDRIRPRALEEMITAKDTESFLRLLMKSPYGRRIDPTATSIESDTDSIRYRTARRILHFSCDPQVVYLAFMLLRSMETEDIIRIIEGVRYKLPPDRIEKLLYKG